MKIPEPYTSRARITAETGSVKSNIQVSPFRTTAGALSEVAKSAQNYYLAEKRTTDKLKAGKLSEDATVEIFNARKESELLKNPEDGVKNFNEKFNKIINKYKVKADNKFIKDYFETNLLKEKKNHVTSILKQTRDNLVTTRTDQVNGSIKRKIFDAVHSKGKIDFKTLNNDVINDYNELRKEGLIGPDDVNKFKKDLPKVIEIEMINKLASENAARALVALDDPVNFTTLKGEERQKIKAQLRTQARFQSEVLKSVASVKVLDVKKKIAEEYKGNKNQYFGIDPKQLSKYKTGNVDYDRQIVSLNDKIINKKISENTDFQYNSKIINKILKGEISNSMEKFILEGESESLSITERVGSGKINLDNDEFFTNLFEVQNNKKINSANKEFFNFINKIVPLVEGTPSTKIFDEKYNSRLSSFRQEMYGKFVKGLQSGTPVNELLSPTSNNYIAKDLLKHIPPKTKIREALMDYASKKEEENKTISVPRKKNESYESWRKRWQQSQQK